MFAKKGKRRVLFAVLIFIFILMIYIRYFSPSDYRSHAIPAENVKIIGTSLVLNADFESIDDKVWHNIGNEEIYILPEKGRSGSKGVVIHVAMLNDVCQMIALKDVPEYILVEGWVRTENFVTDDQNTGAIITIACMNPAIKKNWKGRRIYGQLAQAGSEIVKGVSEWKKLSFAMPVPSKTVEIEVWAQSNGIEGLVYFDDINVYPAEIKTKE